MNKIAKIVNCIFLSLKQICFAGLLIEALSGNLFAEQQTAQSANPFGSLLPLIVIFVIFYFFLIRPQNKKAKEHQNMLNAVKKDDKIITTGGLHGTITNVKGDVLEVKIAEGVKVQIAKSAVGSVLTGETSEPAAADQQNK